MQAVLNAGSRDGEGKPKRLVAFGMMPSGRHFDLGTVIEIVANTIEIIEWDMAEQPIIKETLAISTPASRMDRRLDGVASLPDVLAQSGNVTAVWAPLKTIAHWRARYGSQFQLEIERGVPVAVCNRHELEHALENLVASAENAMGEAAHLLVNVEREDGVDQGPFRPASPGPRLHESRSGPALSPLLSAVHRNGPGTAMAMEFELSSNHTAADVIAFRADAVITMQLRRIWASVGANAPLFPAGRRRPPPRLSSAEVEVVS